MGANGDTIEERVSIAGRDIVLVRPREWESLLTEEAFEREELLPYWAHLWGSAVALAEAVAGEDMRGRRVLELGCGLGLPSIAAAQAGAYVRHGLVGARGACRGSQRGDERGTGPHGGGGLERSRCSR